tara:strand:+ start:73 stop:576 length:504 start_codon:yes stop_codon:yes gene_type:complete
MDIYKDQAIHTHLATNKDFLEELKSEFRENEVQQIIKYCIDINSNYPEVMDLCYELINDQPAITNALTIGWESENWGPGGDGFVSFDLIFGLVKMTSSDYEDDGHLEIFDKKTFYPWSIENATNDLISINSDIYSEQDMLNFAEDMGMDDNTQLTINDKEVIRKKNT